MLQKIEISKVHTTADQNLTKYVNKKIGGLDKYIPRQARGDAQTEVFLKESKAKNNNCFTCEVTLSLPHQQIVVSESALNMYAAVDIAEAKLKVQLKKYKDQHSPAKTRRRLSARFLRRPA
ncbi:MAG TPA: ribosome-associated translation inhibitor RaiA [Candidatus Saccharimonadales bacterium]|nr:ribosome-associated translation inhibitor RaiA [Candidatus Saccharimonadales bacterium]